MRARGIGTGGAALLAALSWAAGPAQTGTQFRAGVDLVRLPVIVTARDGLLVRGLTAADFQVIEDGVPQAISAFAEGAPGEALPLHLGLLLDGSESMELDLPEAANAAVQFVTGIEEAVDVTFVDFDTTIRMARYSRDNYPHLFARIRERRAGGMSALFDAIGAYVETALQRGGQHLLLVYTDGGENRSRLTYPQLVDALRFSGVMLYAVGYLDNQPGSARVLQESRLMMLARETGGDAFFPGTARALQSAYARIRDELASRYTIGYESTNTKADGRFRKVQVRLTPALAKSAKARTRTGYLAPVRR